MYSAVAGPADGENLVPRRSAAGRASRNPARYSRSCDGEGLVEVRLRFRRIRLRRLQRDFAGNTIDLGLPPPFLTVLYCSHRLANVAPCVVEMAEFSVGFS